MRAQELKDFKALELNREIFKAPPERKSCPPQALEFKEFNLETSKRKREEPKEEK